MSLRLRYHYLSARSHARSVFCPMYFQVRNIAFAGILYRIVPRGLQAVIPDTLLHPLDRAAEVDSLLLDFRAVHPKIVAGTGVMDPDRKGESVLKPLCRLQDIDSRHEQATEGPLIKHLNHIGCVIGARTDIAGSLGQDSHIPVFPVILQLAVGSILCNFNSKVF